MRSARLAIVSAAMVLVLLPIAALLIAYGYERWLMFRFEGALDELAAEAVDHADLSSLAQRGHVELFRIDRSGNVVDRSDTRHPVVNPSAIAAAQRAFTELFGEPVPIDPWIRLDAETGPVPHRDEVRAALGGSSAFRMRETLARDAVLFSFARPDRDGGAIYVQTASLRGLRRLVSLRSELLKLSLYQLAAAVVFALLLGRWLVKPLERLADGAAAYPSATIADPKLLQRGDEVGQLARSFDALTHTLEERRRATVELAADMAHELKNPLATIAASAELFGTTRDPSPEKRALLEAQITGAVERLRAATDELLSLVRLEATLPELPRERLDYAHFLDEVLEEYRRDPRYEDFVFKVAVAADAREVQLIPSAWKRLLRNLLDNALVQPSARRELHLDARRSGGFLELRIRDFGPGISEGNRDKIFRRFFTQRLEGAEAGTGLGLSIVQAVARAHGGEVTLEETDGPGATFRVATPLPHRVL